MSEKRPNIRTSKRDQTNIGIVQFGDLKNKMKCQ